MLERFIPMLISIEKRTFLALRKPASLVVKTKCPMILNKKRNTNVDKVSLK